MSVQDIIALSIVAVAVVYAGRSLWRTLHGESGCSDCGRKEPASLRGKGDGAMVETPPAAQPTRTLKRTPLVPIDDVGRPR